MCTCVHTFLHACMNVCVEWEGTVWERDNQKILFLVVIIFAPTHILWVLIRIAFIKTSCGNSLELPEDASLSDTVGCAPDWWSGGWQFDPRRVGNILSWRLIMKHFLRSFSTFCWFKKGNCQFLAKDCAQYWLTAKRTKPAQLKCG